MVVAPVIKHLPEGFENLPKEQAAQTFAEILKHNMQQFGILTVSHRTLVEWIEAE